ncbi:MAG: OsmC family protein [Proteobacteria bacterium]|nr:OsmC family protein [Pseudomonadota bacterium]MBU1595681.1 OsmC family protein [Pseudomonadota bacterium]
MPWPTPPRSTAGGPGGFRPHDLLEAAVASCLCIVVRMAADKRGIPLAGVRASVAVNRDAKDESVFEYSLELEGDLTAEQRTLLLRAATACPVKRTLSRRIAFRALE